MTFKQFNSPHSHSDHSLDGGSTLSRIAKRNKELGATHICSTEHGNINGAMDLLSAAKDHSLKPVFGCEVYLESPFRDYLQSMYEATVPDEALTDEDEDILNYDDLDDPDAFV